MPPPLLVDLDGVDLTQSCLSKAEIYQHLPQRFEFELLDGVCFVDRPRKLLVAFVDIQADGWWVRGHVPGRPLLPGVLMLEMAAQSSAVLANLIEPHDKFIGFGGVDDCKFRDSVTPPARFYLLCQGIDFRARRIVSETQGVVDGRLVFEAKITGMAMR
jgi:3-hydroxyacyl-[acyl-carrier-protein] dehydratase